MLLTTVIASLSMAYIPLELVPGPVGTADALVVAILYLGVRYRVFNSKFTAIELMGSAFIAWLIARMSLLAILEGHSFDISFLRDGAAVFSALILFRISKIAELRKPILNGLLASLLLAIILETYQLVVGHDVLRGMGYQPPDFNYDTSAGTYRPFGGFYTPVVFGAYLALILSFASFAFKSTAARCLAGAGAVGLILTYTRGAWIGLIIALLAGVLLLSPRIRSRLAVWLITASFFLTSTLLMFPEIVAAPVQRLLTITDAGFSSNAIRLELWVGTLKKVSESPLIGFGPSAFSDVMAEEIGVLAQFGHPHNTFLLVFYRYGTVGLILLLSLLFTICAMLVRDKRAKSYDKSSGVAILIAFLICSFVETTWGSTHIIALLFTGLGLSLSSGTDPQVQVRITRPAAPRATVERPTTGSLSPNISTEHLRGSA
ncbi:O-antigen ligase [Arthrobacter sp. ZGTC212]|uniref:O-antigen ligase family protein n=1 Tax=Arthrobacter sp. ZGTC212 TaxID=2058899 RepID=UPI000CE2ECCE|nr:O-antigen ligase family protein [Arthrobacter sp. ZGTC212]